jgi:hypothetical protein
MMRDLVLIICLMSAATGCAKYNTHKGRVGPPQTPSPLSEPQQVPVQAVAYGSAPVNRVPALVQPVTRTVWIKGYQRRPGEYVGDYPLTLVYTQADFVQDEPPAVVIPHAIRSDGGTAAGPSGPGESRSSPVTAPAASPPTGVSRGSAADETLRRYLDQTPQPAVTGVPAMPDTTGSIAP